MLSMGKRMVDTAMGRDGRKRLYSWTVGCELSIDEKGGEVLVSRITRNTPAHFCGKLAEGDRVMALNGEPLEGTSLERWQACWMDEDLGSPIWLKVAPHNTVKAGATIDVCLVRCGEEGTVKRKPPESQREGCVGVVFEDTDQSLSPCGGACVAHLEDGGAAWLQILAPAQIPPPLLAGDVITIIDGETIAEGAVARAKLLLSGPAFSRAHISIMRKSATMRMTIVRSPRLQGTEQDAAVEYRMDASRIPALPPSLRSGRRHIPTDEPPTIGRTSSIREAAAHSLMAQGPRLLLLGTEDVEQTEFGEETRWVAVALVCALLAPAPADPLPEIASPVSNSSSGSTLDADMQGVCVCVFVCVCVCVCTLALLAR